MILLHFFPCNLLLLDNLASHRAQTLQDMLPVALACGAMGLGLGDEHLKVSPFPAFNNGD